MNTDARELSDGEYYENDGLHAEFVQKYGMNDDSTLTPREYMEERRKPFGGLSEREVEQLVARVSERVIKSFYLGVGRSVITRGLQIMGVVTTAVVMWLAGAKFKWWGGP